MTTDTILRAATQQDLEEVLAWLKEEDRNEGTGFWCNRNVIQDAFMDGELHVAVLDGRPMALLAYGLTRNGILETEPRFRGRGLAKQLVERAIRAEQDRDERCIAGHDEEQRAAGGKDDRNRRAGDEGKDQEEQDRQEGIDLDRA